MLADIHGNLEKVREAADHAENQGIKTILLLGDYPAYGSFRNQKQNLEWCRKTLDLLEKFNLNAIPGNCDTKKVIEEFNKRGVNLHGKTKKINGTTIAGYGGTNPTPFNTPFETEDSQLYKKMTDTMQEINTLDTVLIVHQPPKDTSCDLTNTGMHAGSPAIRKIIEEYQPTITLCSHIHEAGGSIDKIKNSMVFNVGSINQGRYGVLDIEDKPEVKLYKL